MKDKIDRWDCFIATVSIVALWVGAIQRWLGAIASGNGWLVVWLTVVVFVFAMLVGRFAMFTWRGPR